MAIQISLQEFMTPDDAKLFGITDNAIAQIYAFYKRYPQTDEYVIDTGNGSINLASYLSLDSMNVYNAYGIFLSTDRVTHERKRMVVAVDETMLGDVEVLRQALAKTGALDFPGTVSCVLEANWLNDLDAVDSACGMVKMVLPKVVFLNVNWQFNDDMDQFADKSGAQSRSSALRYIDVTERVEQFKPKSIDYTTDVRQLVALREYLLTFRDKSDVVLTVGELSQSMQRPFCCIAAECVVSYKMKFEIPSQYMTYYLLYMRRLHQREFFYADEYVEMLRSPVDIGFYKITSGACAYVCVLNNSRMYNASGVRDYTRYEVLCSLLHVPFDVEKRKIVSSSVQIKHFGIERIKTFSLRKLYNLDSADLETATAGMNEFNKLLGEFEHILLDTGNYLVNSSLHCSNVLLFESKGQVYLGYVADISGEFPYTMFPMSRGYTPFEFDLSTRDYENVYDINILHDSTQMIGKLLHGGVITGKCWHRQITGASRGILLGSISSSTQALRKDCGLTLEEVCMWEGISSAVRTGRTSFVIERIPQSVLRDRQFLTCFGGPNPMTTKKLSMDSNSWR